MKTMAKTGLAAMAFTLSGCAAPSAKADSHAGRIIEFKSDASGFDTRTFFYEGDSEVVAFDSQFTPDLARKSIERLRRYTDKPVTWLVITHPNPDKFNGASVFKAQGAKIISSSATAAAIPGVHAYKENFFVNVAKMFKAGDYPQPVPVDETFSGEMDLVLRGGERIQLRELSQPGVSRTQTVAYIPAVKTLVVGDLVHYKAHAWLEGGIENGKPVPSIDGWIADLKELARLYPEETTVLGGRGQTVAMKTAVPEQIAYLDKAFLLIKTEVRSLHGRPVDYKKLAEKFESEFPEYELPYMIEYGAYGLVQSVSNSL